MRQAREMQHARAHSEGDLQALAQRGAVPSSLSLPRVFEDARETSGSDSADAAKCEPESLYVQLAKKRYAFIFGLMMGAAAVLYHQKQQVVYITQPLVSSVLDEIRTRMPGGSLTANIVEQLQLLPDLRVPAFLGGDERVPSEAEQREAQTHERPGKMALRRNMTAKHPVIMIPGGCDSCSPVPVAAHARASVPLAWPHARTPRRLSAPHARARSLARAPLQASSRPASRCGQATSAPHLISASGCGVRSP